MIGGRILQKIRVPQTSVNILIASLATISLHFNGRDPFELVLYLLWGFKQKF